LKLNPRFDVTGAEEAKTHAKLAAP
jgi:hypothetical protein